jgi:DNA-binding NtrC family response regulator
MTGGRPPQGERTVLVVDDDDGVRESLRLIIERAGFNCVIAANGVEALAALRAKEAQVIISDHDMPAMDGIELLRLVAARYPHICRILLSARKDAEPAMRALNVARAYRFLTKPCRSSDLLTTLHFAFEASDAEVEIRRMAALLRQQDNLLAHLRRRFPEVAREMDARKPPSLA